ncbi:MAG: 50S ribosomal protein L17 [Candidatus Omnitrophica bacterium]|nr:50S ribosomal protein L17 [Candidatus Omnitrophota bacterium]
MRHRKKTKKLSRSRAQRKALIRSLGRALILCEAIKTTKSKAKAVKGWIDKLIGWGKVDTLYNRRLAYKVLGDHKLVKRLFTEIAPRFKDISSGYTRIIDLTYRKGDGAKLSLIELTRREKKEKIKKKEEKGKVPSKKSEKSELHPPKKEEKPKRGFIKGVRSIFKKERDSL